MNVSNVKLTNGQTYALKDAVAREQLQTKQNILTPGPGIAIKNNVISRTDVKVQAEKTIVTNGTFTADGNNNSIAKVIVDVNTCEATVMPDPSKLNEGVVIRYTGETTDDFEHNAYYSVIDGEFRKVYLSSSNSSHEVGRYMYCYTIANWTREDDEEELVKVYCQYDLNKFYEDNHYDEPVTTTVYWSDYNQTGVHIFDNESDVDIVKYNGHLYATYGYDFTEFDEWDIITPHPEWNTKLEAFDDAHDIHVDCYCEVASDGTISLSFVNEFFEEVFTDLSDGTCLVIDNSFIVDTDGGSGVQDYKFGLIPLIKYFYDGSCEELGYFNSKRLNNINTIKNLIRTGSDELYGKLSHYPYFYGTVSSKPTIYNKSNIYIDNFILVED